MNATYHSVLLHCKLVQQNILHNKKQKLLKMWSVPPQRKKNNATIQNTMTGINSKIWISTLPKMQTKHLFTFAAYWKDFIQTHFKITVLAVPELLE